MRLKPVLALLFFIKVNFLFAQQIDFMPYIGVNNNITNLVLQMNSTSLADPVTYNTMGAGLVSQSASFTGGFYTAVIFRNNFGVQSGARISKTNYFFYFQEIKPLEFGNTLIYYLKSDRLSVPLHLVYDYRRPVAHNGNAKAPTSIRFFAGPVFSYDFDPETRLLENQVISSATGVMLTSFSGLVTHPQWLRGVEAGLHLDPVFKGYVNVGVLFQYNFTPAARVNFERQTSYESATAQVEIANTGSFTVMGSSLMLQVGVKPFILKKE